MQAYVSPFVFGVYATLFELQLTVCVHYIKKTTEIHQPRCSQDFEPEDNHETILPPIISKQASIGR